MTGWLPVLLGSLLAFAESLLGVGILLPGEVMITGLAAATTQQRLPFVALAVVLGACLGDQFNYWLGRFWSTRLGESRLIARIGTEHWQRSVDLVQRHGALAVVLSRLLPVVRTLVPAVAGVAGLSAVRFSLGSLAGSILWAVVWLGAGTAAVTFLSWSLLPLLAVVPAAVVVLVVSRRRAGRRAGPIEVVANPAGV